MLFFLTFEISWLPQGQEILFLPEAFFDFCYFAVPTNGEMSYLFENLELEKRIPQKEVGYHVQ